MSNPSKQPKALPSNTCLPQCRKPAKPKPSLRFPKLSLISQNQHPKDLFLPPKDIFDGPGSFGMDQNQNQNKRMGNSANNNSMALVKPSPHFPLFRSDPVFPMQMFMRGEQLHPAISPALLLLWTHRYQQQIPRHNLSFPFLGHNTPPKLPLPAINSKTPCHLPIIELHREKQTAPLTSTSQTSLDKENRMNVLPENALGPPMEDVPNLPESQKLTSKTAWEGTPAKVQNVTAKKAQTFSLQANVKVMKERVQTSVLKRAQDQLDKCTQKEQPVKVQGPQHSTVI
ncbi:hypothetical protein ACOMHN_049734 [Nucella lapillus]